MDLATLHDALGAGEAGPVWLLDLELGGRVLRYASRPVHVDGLTYRPGLEPLELADAGGLVQSIAVQIDTDDDWAELDALGVPLDAGYATLRRWWPSRGIAQAEVVVAGDVSQPEYGAPEEPLTLTIEMAERELGLMLDAQAVVDATTWPDTHAAGNDFTRLEAAEGRPYPLVIGYPGRMDIGVGTVAAPAVPLLGCRVAYSGDPPQLVQTSQFVTAAAPSSSTHLRVWALSGDRVRQDVRPLQSPTDGLGRRVAAVQSGPDFAGSGQRPELWSGHVPGQGGGVEWGGRVLRGAGEVIEWLLRHRAPRLRIDWPRMAAVRPVLDRYMVDAVVNEQVGAWAWLEAELFRALPITALRSERGIYLRHVRWDATARDSVAHLDADNHRVSRAEGSRLVALGQPIANEIEVHYRPGFGQTWLGRAWAAAQVGRLEGDHGEPDARVAWHPRCAASRTLYGHRPRSEPIYVGWTWDAETAARIAHDMAARYALPLRAVSYTGGWELEALQPWDAVTLTDSDLSLDGRVALISQRTLSEDGVSLDLILLPRV